MDRILSILDCYTDSHPLWYAADDIAKDYDYRIISLHNYDPLETVLTLWPNVIVTDNFVLHRELVETFPTFFYLTYDSYLALKDMDGDSLGDAITKVGLGFQVWSCSMHVHQLLKQDFGINSAVLYPPINTNLETDPKYLYYDPGHPHVNKMQMELPREEFRVYESAGNLTEAKAFFPMPVPGFDARLCLATSLGVPVVRAESQELRELEGPHELRVKDFGTVSQWVQAAKTILRDRSHFRLKIGKAKDRYRNMDEMKNKIKQALRQKPTRADIIRQGDFNTIQNEGADQSQKETIRIVNQRHRRFVPNKIETQRKEIDASPVIFLSGGVGDVIALESFMSEEQRVGLHSICYGTNKHHVLEPMFRALPNFPSLQNHHVVWNDFTKFWCFVFKSDCEQRMNGNVPQELREAEDWGIVPKFSQIKSGCMQYTYSSFLRHKLCDIHHLHLPVQYFVICPYSTDKRLRSRDFNDSDWATTLYYLVKRNLQGVVLNTGNEYVPDNFSLINLTNKTSILEAIETLKGAIGYIGIDSSMSVLAAKLFSHPNLYIKSQNDHCYSNKQIYYAPKKTFEFLGHELARLIKF